MGMPSKVSSIAITTPPTKTAYVEGQTFDRTGMVVTATYADDTKEVITGYTTAPEGALATEDTTVTVSYSDEFDTTTATQNITVAAKVIDSISAAFNQGGTAIYTSNTLDSLKPRLTVTAHYNDGTTGTVGAGTYTLSGDLIGDGKSGVRTITVTHTDSGKTATFPVTVTKVELASIIATFTQGANAVYESATLDSLRPMLTVVGVNNDGTSAGDVANDCALSIDGVKLVAGTNTVTVTQIPSMATATFTVNVTAVAVTGISLASDPTKTAYTAFETLDPAGAAIKVDYNDGSTENKNVTADMISYATSGADSFRYGDTTVTVNYGGKTATITGLTVAKKDIIVPTISIGSYTYDGATHVPVISGGDPQYCSLGGEFEKIDVGNYQASISLKDTNNCQWTGGGTNVQTLPWSIVPKTLTVSDGTFAVTKFYDGTNTAGTASGALALTGIVGTDDVSATVGVIPVYHDPAAGIYPLTLTVSLSGNKAGNYALDSGSYVFSKARIETAKITKPSVAGGSLTYSGSVQSPTITPNAAYTITGNSETNAGAYNAKAALNDKTNYEWADGGTADVTDLAWSILPAGYTVNVPAKQIKKGSPNTALPAAVTAGVNSETPPGILTWYASENDRNINSLPIAEGYVAGLALGAGDSNKDYTLYWKFATGGNYTATPKTGSTVITIINGDPQNITINGKPGTVTYGDVEFTLTTTVTTTGNDPVVGGGAISWTSSDSTVASVDGSGKVTVKNAGTTTITASAAAVSGSYAAGSTPWTLTVAKKPLTVAAGTYAVTKTYDGTTNPGAGSGALSVTGVLGGDAGEVTVTPAPPAYATKAVVTNANLAANLSLTGGSAANYQLASSTVSVPCSITKKDITAVSVTGVTKTYDGTTGPGNATISGSPSLTGKVSGDTLDIGLTVASFTDANVATGGKTASITLGALTGEDSGNYNLTAASPILAPATITKATITGFDEAAPAATILANNGANDTDAAKLKTNGITLPANVTVTYASGTASLPIVWANASEAYNIKGGTYTYKGTVTSGGNFNAYAPTLNAVLTVTPVQITGITGVIGSMTKAKADVTSAADMTALGFPAQVTLTFDNAVAGQNVNTTWNTTIAALKTLANSVTATADKTQTVTLTNTNFPAWATMVGATPSTVVTITNKLVIPEAAITFNNATITYGGLLSHAATVDEGTYPSATVSYMYTGTGTTVYGPSATAPANAGTYTVTATVENATHKGSKSASLTISPKALAAVTVSAIADQTYTGSAITPAYTVTGDTIALAVGSDYTGAFTANTNVGTATLTVTCKGNYTGTGTTTFNITKATPTIAFTNTSQKLTSVGGNITDVVGNLSPASAGASVTVHYWAVVTPKADCTVVHDAGCASLESGKTLADCDCTKNHKAHDGTCGYVAADIYGWVTSVPQKAGTYKIYGSTAGDANLNPVNTVAPLADNVTTTLIVSPYSTGGGGITTPPVTPPVVAPPATTGTTTTVTTTVTPTTTGSTSKATVSSTDMNKAVDTAIKAAADTGTSTNVKVKVEAPPEAKKVEVALPAASIGTLAKQDEGTTMTVESGIGTITFDNKALSAIDQAATGAEITIVVSDVDKKELDTEQKALVGDRPVVDLSVLSGGKHISDFKGGSATVNIPYTLAEGEKPEGIVIWYLADDGKLEKKECAYDPVTKMVTFVADHFSQYVLAYFPFTDLKGGEWYYENAVYAYTNGLISGVTKDKFAPTNKTTRAMVVTILWRLEGQPKAAAGAFNDVAKATWYTDAINWASANGIVSGYSDSKFGPNDTVTREQMAAIIYNYGSFKKYNMKGKADLGSFADASKVSAWAAAPVQWAVENGIITGTGKGLNPKGSAERAQVAAILQRFIEKNK
ncbi:hypothetical protein MASR2M70_05700 [Bacillota bacterium]